MHATPACRTQALHKAQEHAQAKEEKARRDSLRQSHAHLGLSYHAPVGIRFPLADFTDGFLPFCSQLESDHAGKVHEARFALEDLGPDAPAEVKEAAEEERALGFAPGFPLRFVSRWPGRGQGRRGSGPCQGRGRAAVDSWLPCG